MPIYEFTCAKCQREFELLVFDSTAQQTCPHCGSKRLKKLPSVFAHKSDAGFTPSSGSSSCSSCSSGSCSGCSGH